MLISPNGRLPGRHGSVREPLCPTYSGSRSHQAPTQHDPRLRQQPPLCRLHGGTKGGSSAVPAVGRGHPGRVTKMAGVIVRRGVRTWVRPPYPTRRPARRRPGPSRRRQTRQDLERAAASAWALASSGSACQTAAETMVASIPGVTVSTIPTTRRSTIAAASSDRDRQAWATLRARHAIAFPQRTAAQILGSR
jgi:hypothetical protein